MVDQISPELLDDFVQIDYLFGLRNGHIRRILATKY